MPVIVVGDWDADGFVSVAEVVFSQEVAGLYPVRSRCSTLVYPSTPRSILSLLNHIAGMHSGEKLHLVILDIAFTNSVKAFIQSVKRLNGYVVYIDHHLPTHLRYEAVEKLVDELIVGRRATAFLVYTLLKSLGVRMTERLEQFVNVVTCLEGGLKCRNTKLMQLTTAISKAITISRDGALWERVVRWLSSPLSHVALPYNVNDIKRCIGGVNRHCDEKALALDLAPTATKLFNYRVIRLRKHPQNCRFSAIVTSLYRVLKSPVIVYSEEKGLVAVRTRDDKAYAISMALHRLGLAEDLMGHERLAIVKLKRGAEFNSVVEALRKVVMEVG
jgi:hypothetical protein